jgi:hypothetical protein
MRAMIDEMWRVRKQIVTRSTDESVGFCHSSAARTLATSPSAPLTLGRALTATCIACD